VEGGQTEPETILAAPAELVPGLVEHMVPEPTPGLVEHMPVPGAVCKGQLGGHRLVARKGPEGLPVVARRPEPEGLPVVARRGPEGPEAVHTERVPPETAAVCTGQVLKRIPLEQFQVHPVEAEQLRPVSAQTVQLGSLPPVGHGLQPLAPPHNIHSFSGT